MTLKDFLKLLDEREWDSRDPESGYELKVNGEHIYTPESLKVLDNSHPDWMEQEVTGVSTHATIDGTVQLCLYTEHE